MARGARGGTPAIVELDAAGVRFTVHEFAYDMSRVGSGQGGFGLAAANALGVAPERVFKTLVVDLTDSAARGAHAVAIVPVTEQLSLKATAAALGAKRAEMCAPRVAERLTGYVVGGISPFGQRTRLPTVIDETCVLHDTVFVSGGKRGIDLELPPDDLVTLLGAVVARIAAE